MFPYSSIPRAEYPRPDRQRGRAEGVDWINLNGPWQFRFDPARRGHDEAWFSHGGPDWREQIIVPFCWESLAAWGAGSAAGNDNYFSTRVYLNPLDVTRENHRRAPRHEVGWYRRWIKVPTTSLWRNRRIILTIGASDFFTDCWCNGRHIGHHEGGYVPIEFDITEAVRGQEDPAAPALLVIRVEDPMDNREQPVGKQWGWYTTTSGIWQTVFLEPRAECHIQRFVVVPDIDEGRAHFTVHCRGASAEAMVAVDIVPPDAPPQTVSFPVTDGLATGSVDVSPIALWDPGDPKLYRTVYRLHDGERETDVVHGYFGMRKIGTRPVGGGESAPAMLCLNNKPIYLRGALYQSYYPDGVYTAGDASILRNDIAYAREVGFDFLRIHIKLDDPLLLYYADTLGILLMQDFPNFGEGGDTPLGRRRFEEMMRAGIERDCNHPSIIAWCLFNETWGFGGQTELMKLIGPTAKPGQPLPPAEVQKIANQDSFRWVHKMWELAKGLDPTRLIEDMSVVVWEHLSAYGHVDTDVNSWHFYLDDYAKARAHIENVVAKTYKGSTFNYVEGYEQRDVPLINSEYGGVGALDGDRDISWSFKFLTNELRRHRQLSAYIFTELHDVEWEYNGFLNYDRTPKQFGYPPSIINQGDVLPIDAPPIRTCRPGETIEIDVMSSHFSRKERANVSLQWALVGIDTLGTHHPDLMRGRSPIPFRHHRVELARRLKLTMPDQPMLCTLLASAVTPDGTVVAANFVQQLVTNGDLPGREDHGHRLVLRRRVRDWSDSRWSGSADGGADRTGGVCSGVGYGHFEWEFTDDALRALDQARRVRVLCEVSANRGDSSQTDSHRFPTQFELLLNDVPVHRALLPNHPHDSRGALTYLNGGKGAYGYLMQATIEDDLLHHVAATARESGAVRFRCAVPAESPPHGGLSVYCHDCGRYPIGPTIIVEWSWQQE